MTDELLALRAENDRLREALKDCRLRCGELDASNVRLREALPALWGQYDDEGRKLWVDPADALRAENDRLRGDYALRSELYEKAREDSFNAAMENDRLREALNFLMTTRWKSVDKDNMEFEGRVTCYQLDKARAALEDAPQ